ncbi:WD40-repeat-containing domain protein [Pisolithus sp. B1]|nr:WD40-repeat-containing domain protein [Pisolithus sp. B1]
METVLDTSRNGQCQHSPTSLSSTIYMPVASPPTPAPSPGPTLIAPNPLQAQLTQHDPISLSRMEFANLATHGPAARRRYLASLLSDCTHSELLFRDFFAKLPPELAYHILSFIDDPKTLARTSQVCRRWHDLVADESLWKRLCQHYNFPLSIPSPEYIESDVHIPESFPLLPFNRTGEHTQHYDPPYADSQPPALPTLARPSYRKRFQYSYTLMCNMRRGGTLLQSHRTSVVTPDGGVITSVAMDYDQVVVGLANSKIHVFNADSGVMSRTLTGHELGVWAVHLVSRGGFWEKGPGEGDNIQGPDDESQGREIPLPSDLRRALGLDGPKRLSRTPTRNISTKPSDICCSSEGWGQPNPIVVSGGCDKRLRVWDVVSGRCIYVLEGHTSTIRCIRVLHNRPVAVTGSRDATVRVWNIQEGRLLRVLQGHQQSVRCLDVCGNRVVSGSYDTTCRVWNVDTGECLHVLRGHGLQIYSVAFDGVHIASGGIDTTVRVWDANSGNCIALLPGHTALVCQLQLSSSTGLLATGGSDGRVITFSLRDYSPLQRIAAHDSSVTSLQFDSNFLITAGNDGRVRVYETQSGAHVIDLSERSESVWKVACKHGTCAIMCRRAGKTVMEIWSFRPKENSPEPQGFLSRTDSYPRSGASYYSRLSRG